MRVFSLAVFTVLTAVALSACASSKALIDRTAEGQIIWPGPPEKPRVKYLWSVSRLSDDSMSAVRDIIAGDPSLDLSDPRTAGFLVRPGNVFVDQKERLYIADPGASRVTVIDLKTADVMNVLRTPEDYLDSPVGVAADAAGRIYISDSVLNKVFVFDQQGKYISLFEGEFKRPTAIAVDNTRSRIYVADTAEHVINVYSAEGKRIKTIGHPGSLPGEFNFPSHLFVDSEGLLYVTDFMNFRVQVFSAEGDFLFSIGSLGDAMGNLDKPKGVAVDSDGNIYVVDSIKDRVKIFNRKGELLLPFGQEGMDLGQFWLPSGIFIDKANRIFVADTFNGRVQVFQFLGSN